MRVLKHLQREEQHNSDSREQKDEDAVNDEPRQPARGRKEIRITLRESIIRNILYKLAFFRDSRIIGVELLTGLFVDLRSYQNTESFNPIIFIPSLILFSFSPTIKIKR